MLQVKSSGCNRVRIYYSSLLSRVGFNYDLNGDRVTQFRGGLGILLLDYL
jgi:hypothetical protein